MTILVFACGMVVGAAVLHVTIFLLSIREPRPYREKWPAPSPTNDKET